MGVLAPLQKSIQRVEEKEEIEECVSQQKNIKLPKKDLNETDGSDFHNKEFK